MNFPPTITSLSNSLIKQARALRQKKARLETDLFLAEGLHHAGEALESGWDVETLFYAPDVLTGDFARALLDRASRLSLRLQPVSAQVMDSLAEKDNPQGILAVIRQRHADLDALENFTRLVALTSSQDPGNVGAVLRTMDAVGAQGLLLLDGGVDLYHPTVVRASMGALFWKPVVQTSFDGFVKWSRQKNVQLIGTSAHASTDARGFVPRPPWALVLGSEQKGLLPKQAEACEIVLSLPMRGRVSSLNLAVAASVLLYRLMERELHGGSSE